MDYEHKYSKALKRLAENTVDSNESGEKVTGKKMAKAGDG